MAGAGNSYTAEFWQYDSRLGRRFNLDPVIKDWESPYACFSDNPIYYTYIKGDNSNPFLQVGVSVLLGVHAKPKLSVKKIEKLSENKLGKGNKVRIDLTKTDPSGNWLVGSNGRKEIPFSDGRSLYDDGTRKYKPNGAGPKYGKSNNNRTLFFK